MSGISIIGGGAFSSTGGIQAVNRLLIDILSARKLLNECFMRGDDPDDCMRIQASGAAVSGFRGNAARFARAVLLRSGPRILVTHINYLPLAMCAARFNLSRVAVMLHAAELDMDLTLMKRTTLRRCGQIIAVSDFTKSKARRRAGVKGDIDVVHHGLDFDQVSNRDGSYTGPVRFLFVGRMDERYKGQLEVLDAAELLINRGLCFKIMFVGGGRSLEEWKIEARRRALDHCVEFSGLVSKEQLRWYYKNSEVFVMPSQNEGFGLVYIEAMAASLPCLSSNVDAAKEVVIDNDTGFCVPFGNSTALADRMALLVQNSELRARMGHAGRRRYVERFTRSSFEHRLMSVFSKWGWA